MHFFISLAAVLALITVTLTTAMPVHESNGQRLARGLPPLPPKFGRTLPGHAPRDNPTPSGASRSSTSPSAVPKITYTGRIEVRNGSGIPLGVVRNSPGNTTIGGVNLLGSDQDLHVSFTTTSSGSGPFDIIATNPNFPAPFYVGSSGTLQSNDIGINSTNAIAFSNVEQTPPNSRPVASKFGGVVESAIWSINPSTKELKAQYINPNGTKPATIVAYDVQENTLFFVGNITAYNQLNTNTSAEAVTLYLDTI